MLKKIIHNLIDNDMMFLISSQLLFGMLGAILIQLIFFYQTTPTIATVNIVGLEESFIRETSKQPLTQAEIKQKATLFANVLNQTVVKIAKQKHLTLMLSEAVIAGSPDLTQEVADQVKKGISK